MSYKQNVLTTLRLFLVLISIQDVDLNCELLDATDSNVLVRLLREAYDANFYIYNKSP